MPSLDDNIEDLVSSTDQTLDDDAGSKSSQTDAASSPAAGDGDDNELLNVVRDVVGERASTDAASPAAGSEENTDQAVAAKQPDDEEYTDVPFNKHPRFQQLLRKAKTYEAGHKQYQNVVGYIDQLGLNNDEAKEILDIGGLLKSDPVEAWQKIKPTIEKLLVAAGEILSPELTQRVQRGDLTEAAAKEISRAEARANSVTARQRFQTETGERRQAREAEEAKLKAVSDWENDRAIKDPNFAAKRPALEREIAFLLQKEGRPGTVDVVKDQLKRAYDAVNKSFVAPAPKVPANQPRPIRPVNGGQKAGTQAPAGENVSTLDIIRANRRA